MAVTSTFIEPSDPQKGGLLKITWTWGMGAAAVTTGAQTTSKYFHGYFLGVYHTASQATTSTLAIKAHGVDMLDGLGTGLGTTAEYFTAIADIATANTHPSLGIPFHDQLEFTMSAGANDDAGVAYAYIRLPGKG